MPNDTRHRALTIEDARNLLVHVSAVIAERDRLREEVQHWRQVMGELECLRDLLNDGPGAMALAVSTTNGHTPRQAADGFPLDSSRSNDLDDAAHMPPDNTAAPDDQGEGLPADNAPPTCVKADDTALPTVVVSRTGEPATDRVQAEASAADRDERPAAKLHTGETLPPADDGQGEQTTGKALPLAQTAPVRPPEGCLMERILIVVEQSAVPIRGWKLQRQLELPRTPSAELSRLVKRGLLERRGEAIYAIPGRTYDQSNT